MKSILCVFAVLLSVLGYQPVFAAAVDAQLSWEAPTTRADGSELRAEEIAGYRIYQAVDGEVSDDPDAENVLVEVGTEKRISLDLMPRHDPYSLRFAIRTVDTNGLVSALSTVIALPVVVKSTAPPSPPTGVTFEINCADGCVITNE